MILLLDEPAAGMNPNETAELMDTIRFVRDNFDMTILLIEHDMKLVSGICEELTVLNFGQVLCQGETGAVLHNPDAISVFFNQTLSDIADSLTSRINDHFQVLTPAS